MSSSVGPGIATTGLLVNFDATKSLSNYTANLISASETFTNATYWSMANGTITPNVIIAPDGTLTGTLLTQTGAATAYLNFGNINITIGTTYTFSAYVKSASQTSIYILLYNVQFGAGVSNVYSLFNLATVSSSAVGGSPISQTITSVGNGWFRISLTATANSTTSLNAQFLRFTDPGVTSTIYCWGAQIEVGSTATEYFPVSSNKSPTTWTDLTTTASTPNLTSVQALVVAGGGSGASTGAGGGAGGLVYNSAFAVTPGTSYTATVGAGGVAPIYPSSVTGSSGGNSIFGSITAIGGGGGRFHGDSSAGGSGGSGGGGAVVTIGSPGAGGAGTAGQGYPGGNGYLDAGWVGAHGGGGGAGGPGANGGNTQGCGQGGPGLAYDISGTLTYYAGGGGGGEVNGSVVGKGGIGGGGNGFFDAAGTPGTPNTGGGGGGGGYGSGPPFPSYYTDGGAGGSGVVIVRYPQPVRATGGTITLVGNDVVHTFTSGTSSFLVLNSARSFNNSPTYSNLDGGFLTFNGSSSQSISIPSNVLNTPYTGKTIIATARMNTSFGIGVFRGLVGNAGVNRNFNMYIYSDTTGYRIHFSYGPNSVFFGGFSNYLTTLALGQWFTVAVTLDSAGNHNCYLNGVNVGAVTGGTLHQYINSGDIDYIGRADGLWYGDIAQAKIYSRALTAAEILQNYQSIRSRFSAGGQLARFDGSSLTGWTNSGPVTVNAVTGNAAPSLYANISQVAYIPLATVTSFANTTITFDVNITSSASLCNLFFAADATGMGTMLRLEGRTGSPSGFMYPTTWSGWDSGPSSGPTLTASTWYNIKIQITSAGFATWYLNGTLQASTANVRLLGNYIGIHGDGAGTGAYFDNIIVYSGIV